MKLLRAALFCVLLVLVSAAFCPNCGAATLLDNQQFCMGCGFAVAAAIAAAKAAAAAATGTSASRKRKQADGDEQSHAADNNEAKTQEGGAQEGGAQEGKAHEGKAQEKETPEGKAQEGKAQEGKAMGKGKGNGPSSLMVVSSGKHCHATRISCEKWAFDVGC